MSKASKPRVYEARPHYPPSGGRVARGWHDAAEWLPDGPLIVAIDGPEMLDWAAVVEGIESALRAAGREVVAEDTHSWFRPWAEIEARTASPELPDDPHFATLTDSLMIDLLDVPETIAAPRDVLLVHGPGAALAEHDVLWFADLPKRYAEAAVNAGLGRNLGRPIESGEATTQRLFYTDWPIQDRHRDALAPSIDRWIDAQDPTTPMSLEGTSLRTTLAHIAERPFRVAPTFRSVSWGGHWAQQVLGANVEARDAGIGYELIAPENSLLIGHDPGEVVEAPFQMFVALAPETVLGAQVHATFGTSFPIRFDYLDTVGGGDLSVHCHPGTHYMRRKFGFPYAQHESYYVMVNSEASRIFLGLSEDVDLERFQQLAQEATQHGRAFDVFEFVQSHPAVKHQLYAVPAGTPHGSGTGNVVLEVSATPYLYSLRIYDWLRDDADGNLRPVHVDHAFATLQHDHVGSGVGADLVPQARNERSGDGWREEVLCDLPEVFYDVRRLVLSPDATLEGDTDGRFHVLNVVEGSGIMIETASGDRHDLAYAETIVIPAAVGPYTVRGLLPEPVLVVKALVR